MSSPDPRHSCAKDALLFKQGQRTRGFPSIWLYFSQNEFNIQVFGADMWMCVCLCVWTVWRYRGHLLILSLLFLPWLCLVIIQGGQIVSEFTLPHTYKFLHIGLGSLCTFSIEEKSLLCCKWVWGVPAGTVLQIISRLCYLLKVAVSWHQFLPK